MTRFLFSDRTIATVYLVVMCVQILIVEGFGVSPLEVALMTLAPLLLLLKAPYISKAVIAGLMYMLVVFLCVNMQSYIRLSTVAYLFMFVITFIMYYNLIYNGAFSAEYYMKVLRYFILAFFLVAILQQITSAIGIRYFPLFNMVGQSYLSPTHFNSLTFEPSSSARILTFLFLAFLRMNEYFIGEKPTISYLWRQHKWILLSYCYVMIMMGSGTAIVCLAIISLYFLRKQYVFIILPAVLAIVIIMSNIDYPPFQRAMATFNAALTLDAEEVTKADNSAAARVNPIINTFTQLDLSSPETWFGKGTVSVEERDNWYKTLNTAKIGNIDQYGLLSYIFALILIFSCCIPRFLSLETLISFVIIGLTINNFSYIWGCYFIMAATKYFTVQKHGQDSQQ